MKKIRLIVITFILIPFLGFISCNSSNETDRDETTDTTEIVVANNDKELVDSIDNGNITELGNEYTAKYICPNHCKNSGSDKEGVCIECEMELIENPNYETE